MKEREIRDKFYQHHLISFLNLIGVDARVISPEFPIYTEDGMKKIDLLLQEASKPVIGQYFVLEFKRKKIDVGAVEQLERYRSNVDLRMHSKVKAKGYLVAQQYSEFEVKMANQFGHKCIVYDYNTGLMRFIN
jgi:RecB family endonuclease NucS